MNGEHLLENGQCVSTVLRSPTQNFCVGPTILGVGVTRLAGTAKKIQCPLALAWFPTLHGAKLVKSRGILRVIRYHSLQNGQGVAPLALFFQLPGLLR